MQETLTLIVGLGKTGQSIARHLSRIQSPFVVFDTREDPPDLSSFKETFPEVDIFLASLPETVYPMLKEIICSPGVPYDDPVLIKARSFDIPVIGDIECLARVVTAPVIAITGTNGKSTVTTLVGLMAKSAGLLVAVAGNIGTPVLDFLAEGLHYDLWVLELSSFQLDLTSSLVPLAATILNVSPDHLDRHHTLEAYLQAKQRVYRGAKRMLYNREDAQTYPDGGYLSPGMSVGSYGLDAPNHEDAWGILCDEAGTPWLSRGQQRILSVEALRIKGRHNWLNAIAACALAESMDVSIQVMKDVLTEFTGLPHRCQWVRTLEGVEWINDSKGTNIGATISAIAGIGGAIEGKIVLLAGGQGKGADFSLLRNAMSDHVRAVVLFGEDAPQLQEALSDLVPVVRASSLEEAIDKARSQGLSGDVVLLSPACASFDMFHDFNHRGEVFVERVKAL
ncbi:MAG: UDP-N-acetylmuramoyl-L-alanine--D-glutamate ligase [Legionellaceae bacterium]